jgi:alpha-mannosidase
VTNAPKKVFLVSHTHWDREWYLPYHRFRVRLVDVVAEVLDRLENEDEFHHFLLDGQTVVLEDYLEVRPEDEARIRGLVEKGAISLGPWYVLSDEFLVSGEATARNLLIGQRTAAAAGGVSKVGYLPDCFGHIAQMPQILARSGIDSFVYTRGNGSEIDRLGLEYEWEAPDGSRVTAIHQLGGYCNAAALGHEELWHSFTAREIDTDRAAAKVRDLIERMAAKSPANVRLLMNGCDHHPPPREFTAVLARLREEFPDTEFVHGDLASYLAAFREEDRELPTFAGELRGGKLHHILSGVWSARMYLKQANDYCQTLLSGMLEPVLARAHFVHGRDYPAGQVEYAWKRLLKNHPHDSICGCSIDGVHREMESRFAGVAQTAEQLLMDETNRLAPSFAPQAEDDRSTVITVVNPLPVPRSEVVERLVVLQPFGIEWDELAVYDEAGSLVPFEISQVHYVERFWGIDYREQLSFSRQAEQFAVYLDQFPERMHQSVHRKDAADCFFTLRFIAEDLPALGHANYFVRPMEEEIDGPPSPGGVVVAGDTIANDFVSAHLHADGTFDLFDKMTGQENLGLNLLTDTEDVGDEYDYSPAEDSETVTADGAEGRVTPHVPGGLAGSIQTEFALWLPEAVLPNRRRRGERRIPCPVRVRLSLKRTSRMVEVEVAFENRASDHRLRVEFPTGVRTSSLVSDGQYMVHERPISPPDGTDWVQPPPDTLPQQDFSLVQQSGRGLALLNRGLPEIAATRDAEGAVSMHLTLLRSVGWLSRDDFVTRRCQNAGPTIPTPRAQCRGVHRFRYALLPFAGDWLEAGVKSQSDAWRVPVLTKQGVEAGLVPGGQGLLAKANRRTAVTAIKRHEERDSLVVRVVNLTDEEVHETLALGPEVKQAWRTNLLEEREEQLEVSPGNIVRVGLSGCEIGTVELVF